MTVVRSCALLALSTGILLTLVGCASPGIGYSDLHREREARDEIPDFGQDVLGPVDVSTSRYIGAHEGTSVWIAEGLEPSTICLVLDAGAHLQMSACGGLEGVGAGGLAGDFRAQPDDAPAPQAGERISMNVYASPPNSDVGR